MYVIVGIILGVGLIFLMVCTCCISALIMSIPFVGICFMLPVVVYYRLLGLEFLARIGNEFNVFVNTYTYKKSAK